LSDGAIVGFDDDPQENKAMKRGVRVKAGSGTKLPLVPRADPDSRGNPTRGVRGMIDEVRNFENGRLRPTRFTPANSAHTDTGHRFG